MTISINVKQPLDKAEKLLFGIRDLAEHCADEMRAIEISEQCTQIIAGIEKLKFLLNTENANNGQKA